MALVGVLIAFCAAMVGSQRNELTRKTLIEQTQAHSDYSSASTKFRLIMMELEKLRSISSPNAADAAQLPTLKRFLRLYSDYSQERAFAKTWAAVTNPRLMRISARPNVTRKRSSWPRLEVLSLH
jgi:hypothetical protein